MSTSTIKALTKQRTAQHNSEGQEGYVQMSRWGSLFTADWRMRLVMMGFCFDVTVGDAANTGGAPAGITGGGGGTTIDSDRPELIVGVNTGYYLIPLECKAGFKIDLDADAEIGEAALFADTTQWPPATATATVETPSNLLDGGPASVARAYSAVTADITDPVASILLDYDVIREAEISAVSHVNVRLKIDYRPDVPVILQGPCSVVLCWGGTAATTGLASLKWAEVPASFIEGL